MVAPGIPAPPVGTMTAGLLGTPIDAGDVLYNTLHLMYIGLPGPKAAVCKTLNPK